MKAPLEKDIQKAIKQFLELKGCFVIRVNSGAMTGEYKGKRRFVRFASEPGVSDLVGMLPDGRFLAVEVKRVGNKATPEQQSFIDRVNQQGGLAFVARSIEDAETALQLEGY